MEESKWVSMLGNFAAKVNSYKYIIAIKNAFTMLLPVIITGAFATLISNMVFGTTSGLAAINGFGFLENLKPITDSISYATLNFLTISAVFLIGMELGKLNQLKGFFPGLLAVISYITIIPKTIETLVNESPVEVVDVIAKQYTNSSGLFLGMFVAILSIELFSWLQRQDKLNIHMPDSVPSNVSASFSALIPTILTITIISALGFAVLSLTGMTLYDIIYTIVQEPLSNLVSGLPGILLLMFVSQVFWVIGIHGNQIIKPIREPILLAAIAENTAAFEAGEAIPNIINMPFWDIYMSMGGSGVTFGLLIAIFIVSKREDYRSISKLSFAPGIFNINEPMIFGLPIMLNPVMAIPFIITPLITGVIGYFATAIGFAGPAVVMIPWTTPPIISAYLATAGSLGAVATQLICIVVATLVYLPFVKASNVTKRVDEVEEVPQEQN